ncbi:iron ABC transporter ATP-binding protein [Pseudomonas asiatica]
MIDVRKLSKRYNERTVVDDVSLSIDQGGITVIIGPNGAGKSSFLSLMSRLSEPSAGSVSIDGMDVMMTANGELAKHLAVLRQDNQVAVRLTVRDLVSFGRFPHSKGRLTEHDQALVTRSIGYLNLAALADRYLDELSGGERQRAFIAMVLCQDTRYVFLDEPLNGLDMKQAAAMMGTIRRAADELGKTMVIVLHDINFASAYADQIIAMRDGCVVHHGSPDAIIQADLLSDLYDTPIVIHDVGDARICTYYRAEPVF